jgi:Uma2 family endonuclease
MATTVETTFTYKTLADAFTAAREVPLDRIRMHPQPGTATERDLLEWNDQKRGLCELINGILVEKTAGLYEAVIAGHIATELNVYVRGKNLGLVLGAGGPLRMSPGQIRLPDASYLSWEKFPGCRLPREAVWRLPPDLAVEVLSPSNSDKEIALKIEEYFAAGAKLVWIIDPVTQTTKVYRSTSDVQTLSRSESLSGEELLPGLSIPLARIFTHNAITGEPLPD